MARARELSKLLIDCNFPAICIHSAMGQEERWAALVTRTSGRMQGGQCGSLLVGSTTAMPGHDMKARPWLQACSTCDAPIVEQYCTCMRCFGAACYQASQATMLAGCRPTALLSLTEHPCVTWRLAWLKACGGLMTAYLNTCSRASAPQPSHDCTASAEAAAAMPPSTMDCFLSSSLEGCALQGVTAE